jgi:carboxyl-terminal processing protease
LPKGQTGITLTRQYYLRVLSARDESTAAVAGLRPGDYIRAIDGESTRNMSIVEGNRLLRGSVGSTVTLTVIRGNAAEPQEIVLERTPVSSSIVRSRLAAADIGYLRLIAFDRGIAEDIVSEVDSLTGAGARQLIIDLRGTADGNFNHGLEAARLFVGSGTLAIRQRRGEPQDLTVAQVGDGSIGLPTVILIGAGTSGAAELFASALTTNGRAELIGGRTLGRVAEQRLIKLVDGTGLWLYSAKYLTGTGEPLHQQGLEPSVAVAEPSFVLGAVPPDVDPVLEKALEQLADDRAT